MSGNIAAAARQRGTSVSLTPEQQKVVSDLEPLIESLDTSAPELDILVQLQRLKEFKRLLKEHPAKDAQNAFRQLQGFEALLKALKATSGHYNTEGAGEASEEERRTFVEYIRSIFNLVSEGLLDHNGNRRYFSKRNGFAQLEEGLAATGLPVAAPDQAFGLLLSFAMNDESLAMLLTSTRRGLPEDVSIHVEYIRNRVTGTIGPKDHLHNPGILPIIVNFFFLLDVDNVTSMAVLQSLLAVASGSKYNLVAMHATGVLSSILPQIWDKKHSREIKSLLRKLGEVLMELGVDQVDDAKYLFTKAMVDEDASLFLLKGIQSSRTPPHIQFDLSLHGFSSLELSALGRQFPPTSSAGYTFTSWIRIEKFDKTMHTTLFGAFDATQKCFLLAYLEQDTQRFILQTSISSQRASVRFKSMTFQEGVWYHIALVHRRGRATSAAKAYLYIDGEFMEQVKCSYPSSPPTPTSPVQIFLGTPSDLSPRLGRGVVSSCWSLASAYLFEDILSDDLISVHFHLGPRYFGNFQDCLGSFQTYEASALLNMRNELMHPGKEEKSDIISAIRQKASGILHESKILLNISAAAILDDDSNSGIDEGMLKQTLTRQAAKNLTSLTRTGPVAINGAIPLINEALCVPPGIAVMTGEPVPVLPQALDESAWRIGGAAAVGLKLVEAAKTPRQVCQAVEILFEVVKMNWRNSEAMERDNGFGILAHLLRTKEFKGIASKTLLDLILGFIGYDHDNPEESIMINPLAYRILLVDFDMWRKADIPTQQAYFAQFVVFGTGSKYRNFNTKRLFRMRIVKKLLFALKGESFRQEVLPDFLAAFKSLIGTNMSADVLRSVSLFITYSLHKSTGSKSLRLKRSNVQLRRQGTGGLTPSSPNGINLRAQESSQRQVGIMVLEMYSELLCEASSVANIKKFARTVTNKWLLYLLAENEARVVVLATKIIARVLVVHGPSYVQKFHTKTGGFIIMRYRLKRWWNTPTLWPICFCILFGVDVAKIESNMPLDLFHLLDLFKNGGKLSVVYQEMWPVISAMMKTGVGDIAREQAFVLSLSPNNDGTAHSSRSDIPQTPSLLKVGRRRSLSLDTQLNSMSLNGIASAIHDQSTGEASKMLQTICQFFSDLHRDCILFRDFCAGSLFLQEMFHVLFPVVCSSDAVSAETELNSKDSALTFDGGDVIIKSVEGQQQASPSIVRTVSVDVMPPSSLAADIAPKTTPLKRGNSFVLITSELSQYSPSAARLSPAVTSPTYSKASFNDFSASNALLEGLLEIIVAVFVDMVLVRRDFPGFGLLTKIPPGFQEHQIYFESYLLRNVLSHLKNDIAFNLRMLTEPRILTNVARFAQHMTDSALEGWFLSGVNPMVDFVGMVLEFLERREIASMKSVRLCNQSIVILRVVFHRLVLFRLSELQDPKSSAPQILEFMNKMMYWQNILLSPENLDGDQTRLMCYLLYTRLVDERLEIRLAAADLWRILLVQKPVETSVILNQAKSVDDKQLSNGFKKLMGLDNETFLAWTDDHREELDAFFFGALSKAWDYYVSDENKKIEDTAKARIAQRKDKLKQWTMENISTEDIYSRHQNASAFWMSNIYASEHLKYQRATQDQQDNVNFVISIYAKIASDLSRPCGLLNSHKAPKWTLDMTEGRNRMRKRLVPDTRADLREYQPKRRLTAEQNLNIVKRENTLCVEDDERLTITSQDRSASPDSMNVQTPDTQQKPEVDDDLDDFEMVEDPRDEDDEYEDKNRKVMRSLQHGDVVEHVSNVSRLVGLETCEGLLILGKHNLYMVDNFFQRSDSEIVNVWNAPPEERDQYLQIISGHTSEERKIGLTGDHETRHWPWGELLSISKRRFLFRDVALELFFADGRSYLLTTMSVKDRNTIHTKISAKAINITSNPASPYNEEAWRMDSLGPPTTGLTPITFGVKLASVFASASANPATKRWLRREISNFHYLMLVNTMAGRTFNDLTQYPVFPWVLADYTSEELDLTNPATFRDFSKPMGAQSPERAKVFQERYKAFADMDDGRSPPFHYGTHYSSAMIVCSFLIRLHPFVESYLLLQGGNFDHADRLFYSVEKAWISASKDTTTDVRELIPEFFFLPEFLLNSNSFNFGNRQGSGEAIDSVALPPWAHGDPHIFVAKHREALESPYVTEHLHEWIDLIFGSKQRGETALENANVFHHLSYSGAIDLDNITDQVERIATIGIIHNFGQTPHQVFPRPHPRCDEINSRSIRLDVNAESLIRLPFPLMDTRERVHHLTYSTKFERVLASPTSRLHIPSQLDKYLEWGFFDGSIRVYHAESRKMLGLFEHPHQGQLSAVMFVDGKTLITAGTDCTISIWALQSSGKVMELHPKVCLYGHKSPVTLFAISRSFSTLVSVSVDETVILWDLNRMQFVRQLPTVGPIICAAVNDVSGDIALCSGPDIYIFTLNGDLLLTRRNLQAEDNPITACAFYEGSSSEWLHRDLIFTGHKHGIANIWNKTIVEGKFDLVLIKGLQHINQYQNQVTVSASITSILPMARTVYTGDEWGRVYEWDCVSRSSSPAGR